MFDFAKIKSMCDKTNLIDNFFTFLFNRCVFILMWKIMRRRWFGSDENKHEREHAHTTKKHIDRNNELGDGGKVGGIYERVAGGGVGAHLQEKHIEQMGKP